MIAEWRYSWLCFRYRSMERLRMTIAWKLPRSIAYWAAIRVMANATTGRYGTTNPTELPCIEALKRWE